MRIRKIFQHNMEWVAEKLGEDQSYFEKLSSGQSPKMLYIGCSDSRVTAEAMMGAEPGDLFVHRNVANLVPEGDDSSRAVINYAVVHLGVEDIVVCGHYQCGGVKAAMGYEDLGVINPWINHIRGVFEIHEEELFSLEGQERYDRFVELNVIEQCVNLSKLVEVEDRYRNGNVNIHGWVFDIASGKLKDLRIGVE